MTNNALVVLSSYTINAKILRGNYFVVKIFKGFNFAGVVNQDYENLWNLMERDEMAANDKAIVR